MGFYSGGHGWSIASTGGSVGSAEQSFDADCPASLAVGDWVYITGPAVVGVYQVAKADITDPLKVPAVGVAVTKLTTTTATIQWEGEVTVFGGLTPRRVYYLQANGTIGLAPPSGSSNYVQRVGVALDSGALLVSLNLGLMRRTA